MSRKKLKSKIKKENPRNIFLGLLLLLFSIFSFLSINFINSNDSAIFSKSSYDISNYLGSPGALISDFFIQVFGIYSYILIFLIFVWGIGYINKKIHTIKHKWFLLCLFIFFGTSIFNILSANSFFSIFIKELDIGYYAGGFLGYIFAKVIYIDILKQSEFCKYIFIFTILIWIYISKKMFFIDFSFISEKFIKFIRFISNYFRSIKKNKEDKDYEDILDLSHDKKEEDLDNSLYNNNNNQESENLEDLNKVENHKKISHIHNFNNNNDSEDGYFKPTSELLDKYISKDHIVEDKSKTAEISQELLNVLEEFGVKGEILNVRQGPVVTMFEFRPAPGIKTSRVIGLSDDIARSMSSISARISTISGQNAIGIELPNKKRQTVFFGDLLNTDSFRNFSVGIPLILGKDISGNPIIADLTKMPHLLVAGTTGSGKSVSINAMILSILFKFSPDDCKLIMIDPKMLELSVYDEIPHLLTPVVTDPKKAVFALKWAVSEMENRYRQMSKLGVRNIDGFNKKLLESKDKGDLLVRKVQTGFDQDTGKPIFETQKLDFERMPYIVVIVDEMADLMLVAGKDVEAAIQRLAQMARAAGIHLIMATQRPSVDVITGTIKANFPTRISFQVTSKIDSRTILGEQGAEQLLGQGDMLYMSGAGRILRVHGPFVKDIEVERVVSYIKNQKEPSYVDVVTDQFNDSDLNSDNSSGGNSGGDSLYNKALEIVMNDRKCSISYIQRKLQIGYNRAARIVEEMEEKGVLSAPSHTGKREIL